MFLFFLIDHGHHRPITNTEIQNTAQDVQEVIADIEVHMIDRKPQRIGGNQTPGHLRGRRPVK